jgi:hypothetical protein
VHDVPERLEKIFYRHADGCVVINDRDNGDSRQERDPKKESGARLIWPLLVSVPPDGLKIIHRFAPKTPPDPPKHGGI